MNEHIYVLSSIVVLQLSSSLQISFTLSSMYLYRKTFLEQKFKWYNATMHILVRTYFMYVHIYFVIT